MDLTELIYFATFASLVVLLVTLCLYRGLFFCLFQRFSLLGSASIYHVYLQYLVYPRFNPRILGLAKLSPLRTVIFLLYVVGTIVANVAGLHTLQQRATRAAHLSLINLCLLFMSGGREFGAYLLGISRETYSMVHRIAGFMAGVQAAVHVALACQKTWFTTADDTQYYGLLAMYELFLVTHLVCAFLALYLLWKHIQLAVEMARRFVLVCIVTFSVTGVLQALRVLFRNVVFGRRALRVSITPFTEDIVRAELRLPRPWTVRAGERVTLGVPAVGLFYFFQAHPFSITWWEENQDGEADRVFLLFRARTGFTRKALMCLEPDREYWAWIDGPFGPSAVHQCGATRDLGDYGHIFMVTTGIGIAAQLPYMKELVQRRRLAGIRTQRICLVWQLDRTGDYECARDWLQHLVKLDNGYMLKVLVYDPLSKDQEVRKFGYHDLITVHSGEPNWGEVLSQEKQDRAGKILVSAKQRLVFKKGRI
ncbi:hypothetical protein BJX99DRAFT_249151 [Aspergillus californicus]